MFRITPSARLRASPFYDASIAEGIVECTVYNNMLLPTGYGNPEAEYWTLINDVSQWDVAVERQIELVGPDASRLAQILTPRNLENCQINQGKYVALCNHSGILINDPIILKLSEDRFWLSIADSNILFWARSIAAERNLDVTIFEPDVSPMALQGPKSESLMVDLFGSWIKDLKFFWFQESNLDDIPLVVARSGWSKQGGFELYLMDGTKGTKLWNIVKEAGQKYNIGVGNPNPTERVESGILSYGGDTDDTTNPFEVRLEKYIDLDVPDDVIGIDALRRIKKSGIRRHQLGVILDTESRLSGIFAWCTLYKDGEPLGSMTNITYSYRLKKTIGFVLVDVSVSVDDRVEILLHGNKESGTIVPLPFL